eukprot:184788-Prorocentrum_minimum.AAC.2
MTVMVHFYLTFLTRVPRHGRRARALPLCGTTKRAPRRCCKLVVGAPSTPVVNEHAAYAGASGKGQQRTANRPECSPCERGERTLRCKTIPPPVSYHIHRVTREPHPERQQPACEGDECATMSFLPDHLVSVVDFYIGCLFSLRFTPRF